MHNVEAVEVFDCVGQIVQHAASVSLGVSIGRGDRIEQIPPLQNKIRIEGGSFTYKLIGVLFCIFTPRFTFTFFLLRGFFGHGVVFPFLPATGVNRVLIPPLDSLSFEAFPLTHFSPPLSIAVRFSFPGWTK